MHDASLSLPPPSLLPLPLPAPTLSLQLGADTARWVVCLCAEWCGVCRDYRAIFEQVARIAPGGGPGTRFAWVDVEDHADLVGDLDVQTFPTLLIADAGGVRFLGPVTPQANVLLRLLESMEGTAGAPANAVPGAADCALLLKALPAQAALWLSRD